MKGTARLALLPILLLSSCTVLPEETSGESVPTLSSTEVPSTDTPHAPTESDLRGLLLSRDDLGAGWFADATEDSVDGTAGSDGTTDEDADAFDRTLNECASVGTTLLDVDGTNFVNGAVSIDSGATLYSSFDDAAQDMRFLDERAGRDCLRSAFLAGFAEGAEGPADLPPIDIQIEQLSILGLPTTPMRPARTWLITVVADVDGPTVLFEMLIVLVQIGDVVADVTALSSNMEDAQPSDAVMAAVSDAVKRVAQRAQTWAPA